MGKKATGGSKMNLADLGAKFGVDPTAGMLPTHSIGKDPFKGGGKGKGGDRGDNEGMDDWRGGKGGDRDGGGGKGMFGRRRDDGPSRADDEDWTKRDGPLRGGGGGDRDRGGGGFGGDRDRGGGGGGKGGDRGGGMRRDDRPDDTQAGKDDNWRSGGGGGGGGMNRDRDRGGDDRRGSGGGGFSNFRDRDGGRDGGKGEGGGGWGRRGGDDGGDAPRERPKLQLKPRSDAPPKDDRRGDDKDDAPSKPKSNPFGNARPIAATGGDKSSKSQDNDKDETGSNASSGGWEAPKKSGKPAYQPPNRREEPKPAEKKKQSRSRSDSSGSDKGSDAGSASSGKRGSKEKPAPAAAAPSGWVPPSVKKRMEEEAKAREEEDKKRDAKRREEEEQRKRQDAERRERREKEDQRRNRDEDRDGGSRRTDDRESRDRPARNEEEFSTVTRSRGGDSRGGDGGGAGKYVPPGQARAAAQEADARRKAEGDRRKEEEKARKQKEEEAKKKKADDEAKKREQKRAKEERDKEEAEKRANKDSGKKAGAAKAQVDEQKLQEFEEKVEGCVDAKSADIEELAEEVSDILGAEELKTVHPVRRVLTHLMRFCREKPDEDVVAAVARFEPLFTALIEAAYELKVHRFKLKVLCEAQRIAHEMGLPRLSPASALIEVFFDGLYQAEIIEEGYFTMWVHADDNTPGKINAMFQVQHFMDWMRNGPLKEEKEPEEGEESEEGSDAEESEAESDDGEIVPLGR